jgi:hypothetical protein
MSDRVDYLRVSFPAADGEYGIDIFNGIGVEGFCDYSNYLYFQWKKGRYHDRGAFILICD